MFLENGFFRKAKLGLAIAALTVPVFAGAQLRSLDSTQTGTGTLGYQTRSSSNRISRVRVNLKSDGRAEIRVLSGADETFSGTWKSGGLTKVFLTIDRVGRNRADGTGQVIHNARGDFETVFCSGNVGHARFDLNFNARDNTRPGHGDHDNGGVSARRLKANAEDALRDKFPGYKLSFANEKVEKALFGNRTVKGKFRARGRGNRDATYNFTVVCGAGSGEVKSVHYAKK
jgi:hypothetical protein